MREAVDPEFLRFFERSFLRRVDGVTIPGMDNPSWDRKAAYLLFRAERPEEENDDWRDLV